jgi:hypothetical protein
MEIDFASKHAMFLANALDDIFCGRADETTALQGYWSRRNEPGLKTYVWTNEAAKDLSNIPDP